MHTVNGRLEDKLINGLVGVDMNFKVAIIK